MMNFLNAFFEFFEVTGTHVKRGQILLDFKEFSWDGVVEFAIKYYWILWRDLELVRIALVFLQEKLFVCLLENLIRHGYFH